VGLLDRFTKKASAASGLVGTAVLRAKTPAWTSHDYSPDSLLNSSSPYQLALDLRIAGRDPYSVVQVFEVPRKWNEITTGIELPVSADPEDPNRILIDWDAFAATGGKQIVAETKVQAKREAVKRAVSQNPLARQADQAAVEDLLGEVKAGRRSVKEINSVIDDYVAGGSLTVEEGEAYKARAVT